nr:PREDICTED: ceramide synthase 5-like isoform X3 [Tribolium castaneum]|eukprot:XP_015839342.1 PREDICTED: ceramide synthase 5-like isoform X3 [Tribolium castaneum]
MIFDLNFRWPTLVFELDQLQRRNNVELIDLLFMTLFLLLLQSILKRHLFTPLVKRMKKFSQSNRTSVRNSIFEQAYLKSQIWDRKMIEGLAKQSETSSKEVKTWLKLKNKQSHYTNKISTSLWRLIYHTAIIAYGTAVFWDKPWFWDIKECWVDVYNQKITNGVWWFFMISWAHICCSFLTVDTLDFRKKDFFLTLTHHVVLLEIMWISWKDSWLDDY